MKITQAQYDKLLEVYSTVSGYEDVGDVNYLIKVIVSTIIDTAIIEG